MNGTISQKTIHRIPNYFTLDDLVVPPEGKRPCYSYRCLAQAAIKGSDDGRLVLQEIYAAIEARFAYYMNRKSEDWKVCVLNLMHASAQT